MFRIIMGWDFMHRMSKKTIIVHLPISSKELKLQDVVIMTGSIPFCFLILPVFIIQKNNRTGLKYALECYELGHERKDPYLIYSGSTNTAYMYYLKSDYNTALKYIQEAEFTTWCKNDFYDQSNVYNLYGYILHKLNKDDEALVFSGRLWI